MHVYNTFHKPWKIKTGNYFVRPGRTVDSSRLSYKNTSSGRKAGVRGQKVFHDCLLVDSFFITRIPIPPSFKPLLAAPPPATQCKMRPSRSPGFDPQSGWTLFTLFTLFGFWWAGRGARGRGGAGARDKEVREMCMDGMGWEVHPQPLQEEEDRRPSVSSPSQASSPPAAAHEVHAQPLCFLFFCFLHPPPARPLPLLVAELSSGRSRVGWALRWRAWGGQVPPVTP